MFKGLFFPDTVYILRLRLDGPFANTVPSINLHIYLFIIK